MLANSGVNPWIYCLRIPVMRRHVLRFLHLQRYTGDNSAEESNDVLLTVAVADANL